MFLEKEPIMNAISRALKKKPRSDLFWKLITLAGVLVVTTIALGVYWYTGYGNSQTLTCTVEGKDRTAGRTDSSGNSSGSSTRVYTEDCGVLSVEDRFLIGHFNSADIYAQIDEGGTYEFDVIGKRIPFFSTFQNIVAVREAGE